MICWLVWLSVFLLTVLLSMTSSLTRFFSLLNLFPLTWGRSTRYVLFFCKWVGLKVFWNNTLIFWWSLSAPVGCYEASFRKFSKLIEDDKILTFFPIIFCKRPLGLLTLEHLVQIVIQRRPIPIPFLLFLWNKYYIEIQVSVSEKLILIGIC